MGGKGGAEEFRQAYEVLFRIVGAHRHEGFQGAEGVEEKMRLELVFELLIHRLHILQPQLLVFQLDGCFFLAGDDQVLEDENGRIDGKE